MHFDRTKGRKVTLDMRGDLLLSHNVEAISSRYKATAPILKNARTIPGIKAMAFRQKFRATRLAIAFIWRR